MAWTAPKTWATDEVLTASDMNLHLRDNLLYMLSPTSGTGSRASDLITTSDSYTDMTGVTVTITTNGGTVLVLWSTPSLYSSTASYLIYVDLLYDGTSFSGGTAVGSTNQTGIDANGPSGAALITGLAAGSHTFKLQWRRGGTATGHTGNQYTFITAVEI